MAPKDPKWMMPEVERDTHQRRPTTQGDKAEPFSELNHLTPPPQFLTLEELYEHTNRIQLRTANMLTQIAHSSGVGMEVADRLESVEKQADSTSKKLKKWQALAIAALTAAGSGLVAAGKMLYEKGGAEATMKARMQYLENEVDRLRNRVERNSNRLYYGRDMPDLNQKGE